MPTALRRLVPVAFAALLLLAIAPGALAAATTHAFPNQSLGNRGSDVQRDPGPARAPTAQPIALDGDLRDDDARGRR